MNDNQNFRVLQAGRPSSRVLNPPGGRCSITIGVEDAPPPPKVVKSPAQTENQQTKDLNSVSVAAVDDTTEKKKTAAAAGTPSKKNEEEKPISANAFASGSNMNGPQVMTGRPTSRVLAPPGGHCSIQLG